MIQRIQSVWLLLAAISAFTFYFIYSGLSTSMVASDALTFTHLSAALINFVAIFLFKKRKLQATIVKVAMLTSGLLALLFVIEIAMGKERALLFAMLPATISLAFSLMALRGINFDEKLIKSLDRMR